MFDYSTGFEVGDEVKINRKSLPYENGWPLNWIMRMDNYINKTGTVWKKSTNGLSILFDDGRAFCFPNFVCEKQKEDVITHNKTIGDYSEGFEIGEKVKINNILQNAHGNPMGMNNYINKTGIIIDKKANGFIISFADGNKLCFPNFACEKYEKQKSHNYIFGSKKLNLSNLFDDLCAEKWKDRLIKKFGAKYGYYHEIDIDEAVEYAKEINEIDWLIRMDYLMYDEEEYYEVGDHFTNILDNKSGHYILAGVDAYKINLINIDTGRRVSDPIFLERDQMDRPNKEKISVSLFKTFFESKYHKFVKIDKGKRNYDY